MLDAHEFLTHVIPSTGFIAFAYKGPNFKNMAHRFWPQDQINDAVNWLRYWSSRFDVYHAVASFREARLEGTDKINVPLWKGRRIKENADQVKCFWYDADIKREGDGKKPEDCYANDYELGQWMARARNEHKLPLPNLWIRSGYGIHLYWVLDEALSRNEWEPHAEAFKNLLAASGAKGDIGVSGDCARILRPPETFNHKVPDSRVRCYDMTPEKLGLPSSYPSDFLEVLAPYKGKRATVATGLGPVPARLAGRQSLNAAAKAGLSRAPHDMALIARSCPQVAKTLAEGGANDGRELWHSMVNLAYFCGDREWAHHLGNQHPKYTPDETDAKFDETVHEHQHKDFGAPFCTRFNTLRPGICPSCPHWGKIVSPYSLGIETDNTGLPEGYRRHDGWIEQEVETKDGTFWHRLIEGDVDEPLLLKLPEGYRLEFNYTVAGSTSRVVIEDTSMSFRAEPLAQYFSRYHVALERVNAIAWGDLMKAWIKQLRDACAAHEAAPPFGWQTGDGEGYAGISVGGTFYKGDGSVGYALVGDPNIHASYTPRGTLEGWQRVASFVLDGCPDLQVVAAAAFGAPLMEFTGVSGCVSVWSRESGARKTSAMMVGSAVWCNPRVGMAALRDTTNAVQHILGETKFMPVYWDEIHTIGKDHLANFIENFFNITQGRGKARLDSRIQAREIGYWRTIFLTSSNRPLAELIERDRVGTDAGSVRVFEFEVHPKGHPDPLGNATVRETEHHYGIAGRVYAAWLPQNWQQLKHAISGVLKKIHEDAGGLESAERFYANTVAAIVVGAGIANRLKLYAFDVNGIYRFLIDELLRQRRERHTAIPLDEQDLLAKTFDRFLVDNNGAVLVTQAFVRPGPSKMTGSKFHLKTLMHNRQAPFVHIGVDDAELRFNRIEFENWCFHNNIAARPMLTMMRKYWGIKETRAILGAGTDFATAGTVCRCCISLNQRGLRHHLTMWGAPSGTNIVSLRPAE